MESLLRADAKGQVGETFMVKGENVNGKWRI